MPRARPSWRHEQCGHPLEVGDKRLPCASAHKEMILKLNDPVMNPLCRSPVTANKTQVHYVNGWLESTYQSFSRAEAGCFSETIVPTCRHVAGAGNPPSI